MRRFLLLVLPWLLLGCDDRLAQRRANLSQFVGHPEQEVVQAMGVPNRTYETAGVKYLAYVERRMQVLPSPYPSGPWSLGGYGGGLGPDIVTLTCETTLAVQNGVVKSFNLRGNACD